MKGKLEIIDRYLDKIVHSNQLNLTRNSNFVFNRFVQSNREPLIKEFNRQSSAAQAKKGKQLVSIMSAFKKVFDFLGDNIVKLSTENEFLETKNR